MTRILIVDDSKLARMGVLKILRTLHPDWEAIEAANADEALTHAKASPPDFVLLDYNMPGRDGITLAGELRDLDPSISVAVVSANQQVEVVQRAHDAGATFIPKPLTEKAVSQFLAKVGQRRSQSANPT